MSPETENVENRADPRHLPCLVIRRPHLLLEVWVNINNLEDSWTDLLRLIHQAILEVPRPTGFLTSPIVLSGLGPRSACPLSCLWPSQPWPIPLARKRREDYDLLRNLPEFRNKRKSIYCVGQPNFKMAHGHSLLLLNQKEFSDTNTYRFVIVRDHA